MHSQDFLTIIMQSKGWLSLWFGSRAFRPAKQAGPRLLSTLPSGMIRMATNVKIWHKIRIINCLYWKLSDVWRDILKAKISLQNWLIRFARCQIFCGAADLSNLWIHILTQGYKSCRCVKESLYVSLYEKKREKNKQKDLGWANELSKFIEQMFTDHKKGSEWKNIKWQNPLFTNKIYLSIHIYLLESDQQTIGKILIGNLIINWRNLHKIYNTYL